MDGISDILATPSVTPASTAESSTPSSLTSEEFYDVMIAELLNQDPLEPMDNQQFLNQLVQTQTLEATNRLADGIESLLLGQQISSAGSLIGQQVTGFKADGGEVEGVVDRVLVNGDDVQLGVGDQLFPLKNVTTVSQSGAAEA